MYMFSWNYSNQNTKNRRIENKIQQFSAEFYFLVTMLNWL